MRSTLRSYLVSACSPEQSRSEQSRSEQTRSEQSQSLLKGHGRSISKGHNVKRSSPTPKVINNPAGHSTQKGREYQRSQCRKVTQNSKVIKPRKSRRW
eukprot:2137787-Rhodomonas_salina.2